MRHGAEHDVDEAEVGIIADALVGDAVGARTEVGVADGPVVSVDRVAIDYQRRGIDEWKTKPIEGNAVVRA